MSRIRSEAEEPFLIKKDGVAAVFTDGKKTKHIFELVLTDKHMIIRKKKTVFQKDPVEYVYPLDTIRILEDAVQLKRDKFKSIWADNEEALAICFQDGNNLKLHFETRNHASIISIATKISELVGYKPADERLLSKKKAPRQNDGNNARGSELTAQYCVNCSKELPLGTVVCTYCGKELGRKPRSKFKKKKSLFCKKCGRKLPGNLIFCTGCGTRIPDSRRK